MKQGGKIPSLVDRPKAMDLEDTRGRPKRRTIPPIHLKDYVQVVSWQVGHCVCFICILLAWQCLLLALVVFVVVVVNLFVTGGLWNILLAFFYHCFCYFLYEHSIYVAPFCAIKQAIIKPILSYLVLEATQSSNSKFSSPVPTIGASSLMKLLREGSPSAWLLITYQAILFA